MAEAKETAAERIIEFEDIRRNILSIAESMREEPAAFPKGVEMADEENQFALRMFVDGRGVYCMMMSAGERRGLTLEQCMIEAEKHYLETNQGLQTLVNAVQILQTSKSYDLGASVLIITPDAYRFENKTLTLKW